MHHATNMFSCYIYTAFPRPAVILQCSLRRAFPSQQLFWPSISCVERSTGSKASRAFTSTASPVFSPSSSWRRKATSLRPAVVRSYTARHGEYGNMSEKEFQRHWQKLQLVSLHEIRQIFGENMKKAKGNEILSRLQKRRITGTLDHETKAPSAGAETVAQALTWLRKRYPLDEDAAIVKRIEREEGEREKQFIEEVERAKNWHPQQSAEKDGIYGKPMVDEFAKIWNERQALKIREREEKKKQYAELQANYEAQRIADSSESPDADIIPADARAIYTGQAETSEWMKRYKEKGMLSDGLEPPKMSKAQRLLPMHLLGGLVVLFSIFLADNYKAPPANARMFPDLPVSFVTLQAFTIINFLLFFAWRTPPLWHFMNKNFLNVIATPLARTIVTSAFSHHGVRHLLGNMFGLWLFGLPRKLGLHDLHMLLTTA